MNAIAHIIFTAAVIFLTFSFSLNTALSDQDPPELDWVKLDADRKGVISLFFQLLSGSKTGTADDEKTLSAGLKAVRACLLNSRAYKASPTPVSTFIQDVGRGLMDGDEKMTAVLLYGPASVRRLGGVKKGENENGNSYIAVLNLNRRSTQPSMLVVFFEFAPNSSIMLVAPVIVKSDSSASLFDLALIERDKGNQ